jgi:hypothetical protein
MGVLENMKEVADLIKQIGDINLNRKILTLETEVLDLTRDKRRADEKVEELERALKFQKSLKFKDPYYWLEGDSSPYCPGCWDGKKLAIRIVTITHAILRNQKQCPSCKHVYESGQPI